MKEIKRGNLAVERAGRAGEFLPTRTVCRARVGREAHGPHRLTPGSPPADNGNLLGDARRTPNAAPVTDKSVTL